jgi:hypothetical protein
MTPTTAFLCVWAVAIAAALACLIAWKVRYKDGFEDGALSEKCTRNERKLAARREEDDFDRWLRQLSDEETERLAVTGELSEFDIPRARPELRNSVQHRTGPSITGAFRALTDQYIREMTQEEENYRRGIAS